MGKSSSGKDTIYKELLKQKNLPLQLHTIVPCTTRPIRQGETNGVEYYFYTEEELASLEKDNKIIELRCYHTIHGDWKYFTPMDHQISLDQFHYLIIGTLESFQKMQQFFGADKIIPIFIEIDDGIRLQRALNRERMQEHPKYAEMCRRFLADEEDFSTEKRILAGVTHTFYNEDVDTVTKEIAVYIHGEMVKS